MVIIIFTKLTCKELRCEINETHTGQINISIQEILLLVPRSPGFA
jgi:hypothetical protein